jgi:hypothetical protein
MNRKSPVVLLLCSGFLLLFGSWLMVVISHHQYGSSRFLVSSKDQPNKMIDSMMPNNSSSGSSRIGSSTQLFDELKPIEEETTHSFGLLLLILSILMCIMVIYALLRLNLHFLPGSVVVIIIGMILGASIKATRKDLRDIVKFNAENFFLFLLPPIIFESGYTVNKGNFIGNLGTIHVFALGGTVISAITIGIGMYLIGLIPHFYSLSFLEW